MTGRRLAILAPMLLCAPSNAADYQIEVIAEFPTNVLVIGESTSINASGQVGFLVSRFDPIESMLLYDVYRGDGETPVVAVATSIDGFSQAGASGNSSIDASGAVYVTGTAPAAGPAGVLAADGNTTTARVLLTAELYNFVLHESNGAGQVAFVAGGGVPSGFKLWRRETNGDLALTASPGQGGVASVGTRRVAINESGVVAAYLDLDGGDAAIARGEPGSFETVAVKATGFVPLPYFLDIDGAGSVVFLATPDGGSIGGTLLKTTAAAPVAIVDSSGPFANFLDVAMSDGGDLVFQANRDGPDVSTTGGIYTGSDPVANKVLAVGDAFAISTVSRILLGDINDAGQIAFFAEVADGRDFVLRADPVPEPRAALAGLAALGTLARAWRRRSGR
jgi:hypothetical protein